jgi:glutaredoxin 2
MKSIKHQLVFLGNDDVATPTALVGKKIAPILEMPADGVVMPESLDICGGSVGRVCSTFHE